MRTHVARLLALLLATFGLVAVSLAPASAHDSIISSDPADGAELTVSPPQITLTFTDEIQAVGSQVLVVDDAGTQVAAGVPAIDGASATFDMPPLANGPYGVTWRVVSADGHPIDGTFAFSVADPASTVDPAPEVTALEEPLESPSAEPTDTSTTAPEPSAEATSTAADADTDTEDSLPWPGIIIGGTLGLCAGIGVLVWSRWRKNRNG
ncbi:copper resistance CopC family protein [Sanguibacter antarcticus]|uniref:copper resistance CopC family protein n=1 Tax=Sanguibacter antarcticus TaxID=372484 RepID=UPI0014742544|nr:copper resistance protein CopC [Sanguibacter antarcticus]